MITIELIGDRMSGYWWTVEICGEYMEGRRFDQLNRAHKDAEELVDMLQNSAYQIVRRKDD